YGELVLVRDYEEAHSKRKTLLGRLDVMIAAAAPAAPAAVPAPAPAVPEPMAEASTGAAAAAPAPEGDAQLAPHAGWEPTPVASAELPIAGYDQMTAAQAQKAFVGLDADQLLNVW